MSSNNGIIILEPAINITCIHPKTWWYVFQADIIKKFEVHAKSDHKNKYHPSQFYSSLFGEHKDLWISMHGGVIIDEKRRPHFIYPGIALELLNGKKIAVFKIKIFDGQLKAFCIECQTLICCIFYCFFFLY